MTLGVFDPYQQHHLPRSFKAEVFLTNKLHVVLLEAVQILNEIIPAGFESDGASTPRWLWWLVPPHGLYLAAALLHDRRYRWQRTSRHFADAEFLFIMKLYKVPAWKRMLMWLGVRAGGWFAWRQNAKKKMALFAEYGKFDEDEKL